MRNLWLLVLLVGCVGVEGSGTAGRATREVGPFDGLILSGPLDADIRIGSPRSVELSGDDNLLPLIDVEPAGSELRIEPSKRIRPKLDLIVHVVTPELAEVSLSGSGDVTLSGARGDRLTMHLSGSGSLQASGDVRVFEASVSGSGAIRAQDLGAETAQVTISGSGDGEVRATRSLDVTITGSGSVAYIGNPPQVHKRINGSGELIAR